MKATRVASSLAAAVLFAVSSVSAADLPPIVIKGSHFFYENGTEFFIRGVAYQADVTSGDNSSFTDPLADKAGCTRDIPYLQGLGANVIRVYAINASLDHSACMGLLASAGIYVIQDLSNPDNSINRNSPQWNIELFAGYTAVIDAMATYTNVLGFFAGNEVSNQVNNTDASAFVKAAVRDSKAYIKAKGYRPIGVGYATNDDAAIRNNLADYFNCGDTADAIDFWGYNIYSWCGDSSYTESGYSDRTAEFSNYSVPAFFAEYGCNTVQPRKFTEVAAIYGDEMTKVWSGGVVYMYFQETNDYGLVSVDGTSVSTLSDYSYLSAELATASPSSTASAAYTVTNTAARSCPTVGAEWAASSNLPPIANAELCTCMMNSLSCQANSDVSGSSIAALFSEIAGYDSAALAGLSKNATTGVYGAYSMCTANQQLSFAMNQYYISQKKASTACSFGGNATTHAASTASTCSALLSAAGTAGTGTVTAVATGTSSGSASKTSKGVARNVVVPRVNMGMLQLGIYVIVAGIAGAGMVLL